MSTLEFPSDREYQLAPPHDAAGLGPWDTSGFKNCLGLCDNLDKLPTFTAKVSASPAPFVAVWGYWPVDRVQLLLSGWSKAEGGGITTPSLELEVRAGAGKAVKTVFTGAIASGKNYSEAGRLVCVSEYPATRWEIWLWSDSGKVDSGPIDVSLRMFLDRVGGGTLTTDKSGGIVT